MRSLLTLSIAVASVLSSCERDRASPSPSSSVIHGSVTSPASSSQNRPYWPMKGLDLCDQTRLGALSDWQIEIVEMKAVTGLFGPVDAACTFELRTRGGRDVTVVLAVTQFESVSSASYWFDVDLRRDYRRLAGMQEEPLGAVAVGDQSESFSAETEEPGLHRAAYLLRARFENQHVEVWVSTSGAMRTAQLVLAEKASALVRDTAALITKYRPSP